MRSRLTHYLWIFVVGLIGGVCGLTLSAQLPPTSVNNTAAQLAGKTLVTMEDAATVTGLYTFNRATAAPFAIQTGSAKVTNLDADLLDGNDSTAFATAASVSAIATSFSAPYGGKFTLSAPFAISLGPTAATSVTLPASGTIPAYASGTISDGKLLIGATSGTTFTLATLTAGVGISITNGTNSITVTALASGPAYTLKTAAYTAVANDWIAASCNCSIALTYSGNQATTTSEIMVKNIGDGNVLVITNGLDSIDGFNAASAFTLNPGSTKGNGDGFAFKTNAASSWYVR